MRITARQEGNSVVFDFQFESHDREAIVSPAGKTKARLLGEECRYVMPDAWRLEDVHPDLLACVALMVAGDFAAKEMTFPRAVSAGFVERISQVYKTRFSPVDSALAPRQAPPDGRIGLCFSGGVDSTAALLLLPADSAIVFLERVSRPGEERPSMYRKEAAVRACDVLKECGRDAVRVPTDMEFTREPVGFMNDGAMSTPLLLLADHLKINSVAYGLILESSYLNKGFRFREYKKTDHWRRYGGNSAACGLPWHLLTAGLSEVVTSRLVLESPYQHIAQSCIRGGFAAPCMNCWKCFRKSLLEAALVGETVPDALLDQYFEIREASKKLMEVPIKHENVMMYLLQKYRGSHPRMLALRRELRADDVDLTWTERWFTQSRELFAERYAAQTEANMARVVSPMSESDLASVRTWDRIAANEAAGRLAPA